LSDDLSPQQKRVFDLLKIASNHYRFLLVIICSSSFKAYFEMIKETQGQNVLPVREQRGLYDEYSQKFQTNDAKDVKQIEDAEVDVKQIEDAEVEADELEAEVEAEVELGAEVEAEEFGSSKGVS
jgi:hypothetical protein